MSNWLERVKSIINDKKDDPLVLSPEYKQLYDTLEEHEDDGWYADPESSAYRDAVAPAVTYRGGQVPIPPPPDPNIVGTLGGPLKKQPMKVVRNADGQPVYIPLPIDTARELVELGEKADAEIKALREELAFVTTDRDALQAEVHALNTKLTEIAEEKIKKKKRITGHYYKSSDLHPGCWSCRKPREEHAEEYDWGAYMPTVIE